MFQRYIAFIKKIKNNNKLFIVAADKPNKLQITSSQFITALDKICSLRFEILSITFNPPAHPDGPEIILFSYKFSESQKQLVNSHTVISKKNNKIIEIKVKKNNNNDQIGNAGFFWVNNTKVFNHIKEFKFYTKLRRELLVDDYFEYLFRKKKFRIETFEMKNYVHIGSISEYKELQYWEKYFKNETVRIN